MTEERKVGRIVAVLNEADHGQGEEEFRFGQLAGNTLVGEGPDVAEKLARQPGSQQHRIQERSVDQPARVQSRLIDLDIVFRHVSILPGLEAGLRRRVRIAGLLMPGAAARRSLVVVKPGSGAGGGGRAAAAVARVPRRRRRVRLQRRRL